MEVILYPYNGIRHVIIDKDGKGKVHYQFGLPRPEQKGKYVNDLKEGLKCVR